MMVKIVKMCTGQFFFAFVAVIFSEEKLKFDISRNIHLQERSGVFQVLPEDGL